MLRPTDEERFLSKVAPPNENGCLLWTAGTYEFGYGMFGYQNAGKKVTVQAHLWAFRHWKGDTTDRLVCHTCDVPSCVNLEHLYLGTPQSNMDDKVRRGRLVASKGEFNGQAKITEDDVRVIRASMEKQESLAQRFGITQSMVSQIKNRRSWKHVD